MKVETKKIVITDYRIKLLNGNTLYVAINEVFSPVTKLDCDWIDASVFNADRKLSFHYNTQPSSNPSGNIPILAYRELLGNHTVEGLEEAQKSYEELEAKLLVANKYGAISIPEALEIIGGHIEEFLGEIK